MNTLCFMSNLTSAEWAAWVQAVGSVIAIVAAAGIAIWQLRAQYKNAVELRRTERRAVQVERAKAILTHAINCKLLVTTTASRFRAAVGDPAMNDEAMEIEFAVVKGLGIWLGAIPLHELPAGLVSTVTLLSIYFRQFIELAQLILSRRASTEDRLRLKEGEFAGALDRIFGNIEAQLQQVCDDMLKAVNQIEADG